MVAGTAQQGHQAPAVQMERLKLMAAVIEDEEFPAMQRQVGSTERTGRARPRPATPAPG